MKIEVKVPFGTNEKTELDQELRFRSLAVNETGYVNLTTSVDILDNEGNVFMKDYKEVKTEINPQPMFNGTEQVPASVLTPRQEVFTSGLKTLIEDYMEGEVDNG